MADNIPYHVITGEGEVTVFLLHGAYGDGRYFTNLADFLAGNGYRVVTWDCPGYGSSTPVDPASIENFAAAAIRLIEEKGTSKNVLLGHSMGALIGPYAANRTDSINGVILSAGSAGFAARSPEDQERYIEERIAPFENGVSVADYARPLIAHMMADDASGPLVDRVVEIVLAMKTETFATSIRAITKYDSRPELNALSKPTLLIAGQEDPACTVEGMEKMHKMVTGSEFQVIDNSGHYGFAEQPEAYKAILIRWLGQNFPADQCS